MPSKRAIAPLALLALTLMVSRVNAAEGWITSWEVAKEKAAKEKKDILVDFTGSDWCSWCIRLDNEVFSKEAFKKEAPKHFVLLSLDFPKRSKLPPKLKKQNDELRSLFKIQGFPSILLTDAKGRAYGRTGYQPGGPSAYLKHLEEKRGAKTARDKSFAKAESEKKDVDKAKHLDTALMQLERQNVLVGYDDVIQRIITLDKNNEAGLKAKYGSRMKLEEIEAALAAGKHDVALKIVDEFVKSDLPSGEEKQRAYFFKARALFVKEDFDAAIKSLETALKQAPNTQIAKRIPQIIAQLKTQNQK
jgi:thioredoxin-related protein